MDSGLASSPADVPLELSIDPNLKAWNTDVASEETPSPGILNLKNKFDASSEFNCGSDGKDGDLVELPSPSIHTSLLSHSSLSPHDSFLGMNPSAPQTTNLTSLQHTRLSP